MQYAAVFHDEHTAAYALGMSIGENLQALIDGVEGMNPTRLARETGVPQPTIYRILKGQSLDPDTATLTPLAHYFGKTVAQLRGEVPLFLSGVVESDEPVTRLPLISWVQAGAPTDVYDPYAPGIAESWHPFTGKYSGQAYALRVRGDSMVRPDGTGFPEGSIIAVEPNLSANNGDFVIVRFPDTDEATFKQLVLDGPFKFLKPLNPTYHTIAAPQNAQLCGVVVEHTFRRRFR
jgi:SOS-response transcriptional repressor LexA